jgi:excinuclease ABC subunit A
MKFKSEIKTKNIEIKGARVHNLKNLDVEIARNKLTVVTGVSGSGKSSLVFDTLYAEGQRRYVESLSAYARQFLGKMNKPEVDYIHGISPAIAIEQKVNTRNTRSTVATTTEIYDYLKLLFARIGVTYSPISNNPVVRHTVDLVVDAIEQLEADTRVLILVKITEQETELKKKLEVFLQNGFSRILSDGSMMQIEDFLTNFNPKSKTPTTHLFLLIDRLSVIKDDEDNRNRIADSIQTAFYEGHGECEVEIWHNNETKERITYNNRFELDGLTFEEPSVNFFSFNNPYGACKTCEGFGSVIGIDEDLVVPDKSLSIYADAIAPWKGEKMSEWKTHFIKLSTKTKFPIHKPYHELTEDQREFLWRGGNGWEGVDAFFKELEKQTYKIQYRVMLARYRGKTGCPDCKGTRLRKDASYVKIVNTAKSNVSDYKCLSEVILMSIDEASNYFSQLKLNPQHQKIADRMLVEITSRLLFLQNVGLGYLSLNRLSNTLSGGESQRINLATSLGSSLVGSLYILDEPSIGLHSRDTTKLIDVLQKLRDLGNTVVVVEHDEDIMLVADDIIDIGPLAGIHGGEMVAQGNINEIKNNSASLTGKYLNNIEQIEVPAKRRNWNDFVEIKGARHNNLKGFDVKFPLHILTVVTGVSGSGKTTLVKNILYPALQKQIGDYTGEKTGVFDKLDGNLKSIKHIEMVDQNPIGKSSRSNPITYIKAYDAIRDLFANLAISKGRGYKPQHFSFNVDGGRCETCQGEGEVTIEMQFMADIHLPCEECKGARFKEEVLDCKHKGKNISDVLSMSVDEALEFFHEDTAIFNKIKPLQDVGLGYVKLGQSSNTLSGGEAQRVKLASFLGKGKSQEHILFIFDEPTTGLHFNDIKKLMASFNALINQGHTIIVIEHNMEVIKCADWIIDLGPEAGTNGGKLVFEGIPEQLVKVKESYTGKYLTEKINLKKS